MKRFIGFFVSLVILFSIGFWWVNRNGWIPKNFPIPTAIQTIEQIPKIEWDDVSSGRLANFFERQRKLGSLPVFPAKAIPIETYKQINPFFYNNHGYGIIELFEHEIQVGKYSDLETRPYQYVAIYKTEIGGKLHYLMIFEWLNSDKTASFIPVVIPEKKFVENGAVSKYVSEIMEGKSNSFISPIIKIRDMTGCIAIFDGSQEYCDWYMTKARDYYKLVDKWYSEQKIPKDMGKYPLLITKTHITI